MTVKVIDNMPQFKVQLYMKLNDAVQEAASDTIENARVKAPFKEGVLRADKRVLHPQRLVYRVEFDAPYARFQEFGGDGTRKVRNYTTPGTGAHFLKTAGDEQYVKLIAKVKKHLERVSL